MFTQVFAHRIRVRSREVNEIFAFRFTCIGSEITEWRKSSDLLAPVPAPRRTTRPGAGAKSRTLGSILETASSGADS